MRRSRSFRILPGEPVPEAVVRLAHGRIDHSLAELRQQTASSPDEAIHEVRKDMKKLRALLRLARGELGDSVYRRENDCFRDVARELAGARDADVMALTLDGLHGEYPRLSESLDEHRSSLAANPQARVIALDLLDDARARVERWPLEQDSFDALEPGLRRTYRRARRALAALELQTTTTSLHEWRKQVKYHWHHLNILRPAWVGPLEALAAEAHGLSETLGEDHDLAHLRRWACEHGPVEELDRLVVEVDHRREPLQRGALDSGRRIFAERPRALSRRLEGWWRAWREGAPVVRVP